MNLAPKHLGYFLRKSWAVSVDEDLNKLWTVAMQLVRLVMLSWFSYWLCSSIRLKDGSRSFTNVLLLIRLLTLVGVVPQVFSLNELFLELFVVFEFNCSAFVWMGFPTRLKFADTSSSSLVLSSSFSYSFDVLCVKSMVWMRMCLSRSQVTTFSLSTINWNSANLQCKYFGLQYKFRRLNRGARRLNRNSSNRYWNKSQSWESCPIGWARILWHP